MPVSSCRTGLQDRPTQPSQQYPLSVARWMLVCNFSGTSTFKASASIQAPWIYLRNAFCRERGGLQDIQAHLVITPSLAKVCVGGYDVFHVLALCHCCRLRQMHPCKEVKTAVLQRRNGLLQVALRVRSCACRMLPAGSLPKKAGSARLSTA